MKHSNQVDGNFVSNEVYVYFNIFCLSMSHEVVGDINDTYIITINDGGFSNRIILLVNKVP